MKKIFFGVLALLLTNLPVSFAAGGSGRAEIAFSQGLLNYQKGQYPQAEQRLTQAVALNPEHSTAAYFLGMTLFQTEHYSEAVAAFDKSITHAKVDPNPFFYRGL